MISKKRILLLVVASVLLLQFADCMSAFSQDQQTMQCCGTSTCTPSNQDHDCCQTMTSVETPMVLVKARASFDLPAVAIVEHAPVAESVLFAPKLLASLDMKQYSPPELYTLHGSLLI
jgi:hypothetical protein